MSIAKPSQIQERFKWAAKIVNPRHNDHILEIGIGAGLFLQQLALNVRSGLLTGIDISQSMVAMAHKRNQDNVAAGKIRLVRSDFLKPDKQEACYDKVVSFNLNIYWKYPELAFKQTSDILKPHGRLYIFYQSPNSLDESLKDELVTACRANHFDVEDVILVNFSKPAFGIVASISGKKNRKTYKV